ncbi:MAG: YwqG family protein [Chitinophagales bacterium]
MLDFFQKLFGELTSNKDIEKNKPDPKELLANLQPQIEAFAAPCIRIKTHTSSILKLENSKFGGLPYFPVDQDFPTSADGKPMRLLAQLNFAEIPHLSPNPKEGLLQFYIVEDDNLHGLDFGNPTKQKNWRVLFFEDLDFETRTDLKSFYTDEWKYSPLLKAPLSLQFEIVKDYPFFPVLEYERYATPVFEQLTNQGEQEKAEAYYLYSKQNDIGGHKIGGFPFFTQGEIRAFKEGYQSYQLLFQIVSEGDKIIWGDMGTANFFIRHEDLVKRDFSKVLYNWDCH